LKGRITHLIIRGNSIFYLPILQVMIVHVLVLTCILSTCVPNSDNGQTPKFVWSNNEQLSQNRSRYHIRWLQENRLKEYFRTKKIKTMLKWFFKDTPFNGDLKIR